MPISFTPSQTGQPAEADLPFTGNPLRLIWHDLLLCLRNISTIPGILLPWRPLSSHPLDELHLSPANVKSLVVHALLVILQTAFLISVPVLVFTLFPAVWVVTYIVGFLLVNKVICRILNGSGETVRSSEEIEAKAGYGKEYWIYLNGVSIGRDWLQANVDRLALTFRRPVVGVHNPTAGILFDLIECLVQRNFCYATRDVRDAYVRIKSALLDPAHAKVIVVLHSQGGIMGGLVVDWLLDELPHDVLNRMEVYTFGNGANHFNNPLRSGALGGGKGNGRPIHAIRHIEHYANSGEFVASIGVLHFFRDRNRFMGRLFVSGKAGHLLNQHYLAEWFPLDKEERVIETGGFMDTELECVGEGEGRDRYMVAMATRGGEEGDEGGVVASPVSAASTTTVTMTMTRRRVKDFSRLWLYRNGRSPTS